MTSSCRQDLRVSTSSVQWVSSSRFGPSPFHPSDEARPSVSIVMPTADRSKFVEQALRRIARQDNPNIAEVVIVDDKKDSPYVAMLPSLPSWLHVVVLAMPPLDLAEAEDLEDLEDSFISISIGAKRNFGAQQAKGDVIAHWDNDDVFGPHRLREQVLPLVRDTADITQHRATYFMDVDKLIVPSSEKKSWGPHFGTLVYRKRLVDREPFMNASLSEDYEWTERVVKRLRARVVLLRQTTEDTFVSRRRAVPRILGRVRELMVHVCHVYMYNITQNGGKNDCSLQWWYSLHKIPNFTDAGSELVRKENGVWCILPYYWQEGLLQRIASS